LPRTFSDSGAHVSQIMDSSLQIHLLSHWVRDKQAFTLEEAVKMITCDTATQFGFHDRGLLREGMAADIVVFDPATVAPRMPEVVCDLPGRRQAAAPEGRRHARHDRQRPGAVARQRADRQPAGQARAQGRAALVDRGARPLRGAL
jgi:N-acyl-D-aspartate/D-glutamate deacylase